MIELSATHSHPALGIGDVSLLAQRPKIHAFVQETQEKFEFISFGWQYQAAVFQAYRCTCILGSGLDLSDRISGQNTTRPDAVNKFAGCLCLLNQIIPHRQVFQPGIVKNMQSVFRCVYQGIAMQIEGSIEHHRLPGQFFIFLDDFEI